MSHRNSSPDHLLVVIILVAGSSFVGLVLVCAFGWWLAGTSDALVTIDEVSRRSTTLLIGSTRTFGIQPNEPLVWHATAFLVDDREGRLVFITNQHCVLPPDLLEQLPYCLAFSYELSLVLGSERVAVSRIGVTREHMDVALLEVRGSPGIPPGTFRPVRPWPSARLAVGMEVVAIGSPNHPALAGTATFGRISAIRESQGASQRLRLIQHDAAINGGNSGGPLLVKVAEGGYGVVGINSFKAGEGIGFAFSLDQALEATYYWASATPDGVVSCIRYLGH